ncbi:hypothetical protein GCM10027059_34840 [Myceligenerans halotolerans]
MNKTSIYLDDEMRAGLARVADVTGRSQSELVRDAIDQLIHDHLRTRPRMKGRLRQHGLARRVDDLLEGYGE